MAARLPLNAIFVFCVAARRGSFKLAAQELNVTPGAVSRQIQALEEYLGQQLFERGHRDVHLTRAGERLHERVAEKMSAVEAEIELLHSGGRKTVVRVDCGVTFAMHWLIPRLAGFHSANPGIQVQLSTSDGPVDLGRRVDLHIRRNPDEFARLKPDVLLEEYAIVVTSPKLIRPGTAVTPALVRRQQRIAPRSRPDLWRRWSEHHGVAVREFEPTLELDNTILAIQAAAEGLGVLVVPEMFVAGMLENNALVALDADRFRTGAYYLLRRARRDSLAIRKFVDWLRRL